jgi:hypothetical protein
MLWKSKQIWYAIWQYLNQPLFNPWCQSVWEPKRFWYLYKIQFLETCWRKDSSSESRYTQ